MPHCNKSATAFANQIPVHYRLGLSGLLNPPTRFIYCLYSVFFSFLTPYTLFPFTCLFFVDLKPANPIARLISATSGSESTSISSVVEGRGAGSVLESVSVVTEAPLVGFDAPLVMEG